jgi:hypothetical protein
MYTASISDPISGAENRIIANTHAMLLQRVSARIDQLRKEIIDLLLYAAAIVSVIGLLFISTLEIPHAWIVASLIVAVYIQRAPFWINPIAHIWYMRKCMHAWQQEFDRINAPDTSADR